MAFTDLTVEERALLVIEDRKIRGILTGLMRLVRDTDFIVWEEWSNQNIAPLLGKLDSKEVLPNSTQLAGAQDLTTADVDAVRSIAKQLFSLAQDNLPLIVKAIGVNAA